MIEVAISTISDSSFPFHPLFYLSEKRVTSSPHYLTFKPLTEKRLTFKIFFLSGRRERHKRDVMIYHYYFFFFRCCFFFVPFQLPTEAGDKGGMYNLETEHCQNHQSLFGGKWEIVANSTCIRFPRLNATAIAGKTR